MSNDGHLGSAMLDFSISQEHQEAGFSLCFEVEGHMMLSGQPQVP